MTGWRPSDPAVVLLVGAAASGKTSLRRRLVEDGLPPHRVVSLDELRRDLWLRAGRPERSPQELTLPALREAARRQEALLAAGEGYLLDATSLRRRERVPHVAAAAAAGLPAVALLLPVLPLEELARRNAARPPLEVVPEEALARQAHRHALLSAELLTGEGLLVVRPGGAGG